MSQNKQPISSPFHPDVLKGKVALITGGGSGIGFDIAKKFGIHGAKIAILGRRKEVIDSAVTELKSCGITAVGFSADVRKVETIKAAIENIVEQFGKLDILVNNAAGNFLCSAEELSPNGFKTVQEIDLMGTFNTSLTALPYLKRKPGDRELSLIINITATLQYKAKPFQVHAASAKAGIDVITQTLGIEWGSYGIRVVGIAPGPINNTTGLSVLSISQYTDPQGEPLERFGDPDDVSYTAIFLATNAASYITATTIVVDGGNWHGTHQGYIKMKELVTSKKDAEKESRKKSKL